MPLSYNAGLISCLRVKRKAMPNPQIIDRIEIPDNLRASWQQTVNLLAEVTHIPAALIMRVHSREIEVFISSQGAGNVYKQGEKASLDTGLYCETVMNSRKELLVPNALADPKWDHNPDIKLDMIAYCGLPISWPTGEIFGTICILDIKENHFSQLCRRLLEQFRDAVQAGLAREYDNYLLGLKREQLQQSYGELEAAHKALEISQAHFKRLFDRAPLGYQSLNIDGEFIEVNQAWLDMLGYTHEEVMGHSFQNFLIDEGFMEENLPHFKKTGEIQLPVTKMLCKDGTTKIIHIDGRIGYDEQGGFLQTHCILTDITAQQQSHQRERELKARLEHMLTFSPATIYNFSPNESGEFTMTYIGDNVRDLLGYEPKYFLEDIRFWNRHVHPDDYKKINADLSELFSLEHYSHEYRFRHKDGSYRWMHDEMRLLHDKDGNPLEIIGYWADITERKLAEQAIKQSEARWRSFTESSPDYIMLVDLQGEIQFVNRTLPEFSLEQVIGRPMFEFMPEAFQSVAKDCLERVIESGKPDWFECDYQDHEGNISHFESHVGPIIEKGKTSALLVCARDISMRKRIENELRLAATAFKNTAESVVITDENNIIISVNRAFTQITGYSRDEALGKNPNILKSDRHDDTFYAELWSSLNTTGHWRGEVWDRRKNGELFPAWQTLSVVKDKQGNIVNYVSVMADISSFKQSQAELDFLAYHDPLTELPNRILLKDRLEHAIKITHKDKQKLAVLFLDLDRFKNVNDSLGHPIGDTLLQLTAKRITSLVRAEDTVARLGGDEFVIIMEQIHEAQDAASLAQKLIAGFQQPFTVENHELHLSISLGICIYPTDGEDCDTLIKHADAAMYQAKKEGRNDYQFYTKKLTAIVFERLMLESALRHALERNELVLHYQPQYSLTTNTLIGAEALIRWEHPDLGLIAPDKFIPVAEESGLIEAIGEWVLNTASEQAQKWRTSDNFEGRIAVNVSGRQFYRSEFVEVVRSALANTKLSPQHLDLEITESILIQEAGKAATVLKNLKALGVRISIDDFGTGYSSLSYLKNFSVDTLKIDRSFIRDLPDDPNDEAITRATIALAHNLQLEVIAEGVETERQRAFLQSLSCDVAQGFLYARALPAEEFTELLRRRSRSD